MVAVETPSEEPFGSAAITGKQIATARQAASQERLQTSATLKASAFRRDVELIRMASLLRAEQNSSLQLLPQWGGRRQPIMNGVPANMSAPV